MVAANPIYVSFTSLPVSGLVYFTVAWYIVPSCLHLPSTGQVFALQVHFFSKTGDFCPKSFFFIVASDYLLDIGCGSVAYFNCVSVKDFLEWVCLGET